MKKIKISGAGEYIYEHQMANGFKIYMWPYTSAKETYMTLTVKYGSVHTKFAIGKNNYEVPNGLAHFLEHIKFNENDNLTAHEYFTKMGSYTNAYTTYDHTSYEVICTSNIDKNLEHLLYFVYNPFFKESLIEKEKPIIVEESKMMQKNPYNMGYQRLLNNLFSGNNKRFLVTGSEDDINSITMDDVMNVYNNFYVPDNMFLVVTGNFNPEDIINNCNQFFEKREYSNFKAKVVIPDESDKVQKNNDTLAVNINKPKSMVALKINKDKFPKCDRLHLSILINILLSINFSVTSSFYDRLLSKGTIDYLETRCSIEENHLCIFVEASGDNPDKIANEIRKKFKKLTFDKKDFLRKNKTYIAAAILGYDDVNEVNNNIRMDIMKYNRIVNEYSDILKSINASDGEKIVESIKAYDVTSLSLVPIKKSS